MGLQITGEVIKPLDEESGTGKNGVYNSRWYTDVKAWRIDRQGGKAKSPPSTADEPPLPDESPGYGDEALPF